MTPSTNFPFHVVIPSRFASTRLPGKPLRLIAGKPMVQHVYENAVASGAASVIVATDDERIASAVAGFGGAAMMTSASHTSGTDRLAEVATRAGWGEDEIVVNLQGDEPTVPGATIRLVAEALAGHPEAGIATLATPLLTVAELANPNVVKVVCDDAGLALLFSRAPLPWVRDAFAAGLGGLAALPEGVPFLRHLGLYAYRAGVLGRIARTPPHPIERAESLEQLRALAMGLRIQVTVIEPPRGHGVDTEDDLIRVTALLASRTA